MSLPKVISDAVLELQNDYADFEEHLGGANGYLFFAKNRISGAEVAVKFYYGEPGDRRHDEPRHLAGVRSPYVLPLLDARDVDQEWAFFITKRCREGDLDGAITSRPSATRALDLAIGLASGCSALHASRMVHRDLKPANIVLDAGTPQIADFGSVRHLTDGCDFVTASQHSVLYRPPEAFQTSRYTMQGDVYQVGLTTFQLLGGHLSYDGLTYLTAGERRKYDRLNDPFDRSRLVDDAIASRASQAKLLDLSTLPPWVNARAKTAIRRITHPNPARRLESMADVVAELSQVRAQISDWFWDNDVAVLVRPNKRVEIRPVGNGVYAPFQSNGGGAFRRIPGLENGALTSVVAAVER